MKRFYILGNIHLDDVGTDEPCGLIVLAHDLPEAVRLAEAFSAGVRKGHDRESFQITDVALVKRRGATYSVEIN